MAKNIHMQRNPLFNPGHIFSKFMERSNIDNTITKMDLNENVQPSLEPAAFIIEHSVARLQMCVDLLLNRYGTSVTEDTRGDTRWKKIAFSLRLAHTVIKSSLMIFVCNFCKVFSCCVLLPRSLCDFEKHNLG